ncbi:MAG: PKD domain-containing protein [Bacteroidota bacterium]
MVANYFPKTQWKKEFYCLLLLVFSLASISAQVAYQSGDYANAGDSFQTSIANGPLVDFDFTTTGANFTWDYVDLPVNTQSLINWVAPDDTGYFTNFLALCLIGGNTFFDCLDIWDNLGGQSLQGGDEFAIGGFEFSNVNTFYNKSSTVLEETLLGVTFTGIAIPIQYTNRDTVLEFPLEYQDAFGNESAWEFDLSDAGVDFGFSREGQRSTEVDGWGSLSTPYGDFPDVLRSRTEIQNADLVNAGGNEIPVETTSFSYEWWSPDWGVPVLQVNGLIIGGLEVVNQVQYLDSLRCLTPTATFVNFPLFPTVDSISGEATVTFSNFSTNADSYQWEFGNGTMSDEQNPSATYTDGVYEVTLIACNSVCDPIQCDTTSLTINVDNPFGPAANFTETPAEVCLGEQIEFDNQSANADTYLWDFGDNNTSEQESLTYVYAEPGTYTVSLTAFGNGEESVSTTTVIVRDLPVVDAGADVVIPITESVDLEAMANMMVSFTWSDGSMGSVLTLVGDELGLGTFEFTVTATDAFGCSATDIVTVTVEDGSSVYTVGEWSVRTWPNPAADQIWVEGWPGDQLRLLNAQGQEVQSWDWSNTVLGTRTLTWSRQLAPGSYWLYGQHAGQLLFVPIIIQ